MLLWHQWCKKRLVIAKWWYAFPPPTVKFMWSPTFVCACLSATLWKIYEHTFMKVWTQAEHGAIIGKVVECYLDIYVLPLFVSVLGETISCLTRRFHTLQTGQLPYCRTGYPKHYTHGPQLVVCCYGWIMGLVPIDIRSFQVWGSHYKDKTVMRPSYLL